MLFWSAFKRAFAQKNIFNGWEKTGSQPLMPSVILDKIVPESYLRPNLGPFHLDPSLAGFLLMTGERYAKL